VSIGERISAALIPTPAAASGWLADGAPLDSGSAMIVHSNLSHLAERNTRLVGHALGPGPITLATTFTAPWLASPFETYESDPTTHLRTIPWSRAESVHFGPLALSHTRLGTAPAGFYPRKVRVVIHHSKSSEPATTSYLIAALVDGPDTPLRSQVYASTFTTAVAASPGSYVTSLVLNCAAPLRPSSSWRSRASGTGAPASTTITPAWVWVGWYSDTVATPDTVDAISVFEVYQ
jgi:hypothetical protein